MIVYKILAVYIAVFAATFLGVEIFRRWSLERNLLDIPNERSSHTVPTPRGGGLVIFAVSMAALLIDFLINGGRFFWGYFGGALIVASISLLDDLRTLSPLVRIVCHCLGAFLSVWLLGGFHWLLVPFYGIVQLGVLGDVAAFLWIVWLINAYNFMDGIDGIAATQSVTAGAGWFLTGVIFGIDNIGFLGGVLAASSFGFLLLNWQPAKIFMGDVGSAFLGYSFAVLPLLAINETPNPSIQSVFPWISAVLVWFFVFDSVYTLFRRLLRGAKVWQPHREHIYQNLVIAGLTHARVTILYGAATLILIAVLAAALVYGWSFEQSVFPFVFLETVLLIFFRQLAGLGAGQAKNDNR